MGQRREAFTDKQSQHVCRACTEGRSSPVPGKKHCSIEALKRTDLPDFLSLCSVCFFAGFHVLCSRRCHAFEFVLKRQAGDHLDQLRLVLGTLFLLTLVFPLFFLARLFREHLRSHAMGDQEGWCLKWLRNDSSCLFHASLRVIAA